MKEKTLDKIIIGLAVAIVFMILLFTVGILKEKKNSEQTVGTTGVETTQKTEDSSKEQTSGKVTDSESETASGEAKNDEKVTDETKEETASGKVTFDEDADYVLSESDTRYYTKSELSALTKNQLAIARNEIYARHGYIFEKNKEMKEYFEGKSWYKGTTKSSNFDESVFNKYEKKNIETIVALEGK